MKNLFVRKYAKSKGVYLWQIAKALNISEASMTRKLRKELSSSEKEEIKTVIDYLASKADS